MNSVAGSVYQFHQGFLSKSMLGVWSEVPEGTRCSLFTGMFRLFTFETMAKMLVFANEGNYYYNWFCKKPGRQYPSDNICAYNVADTLI